AQKPAFRGAFRERRCLVPADGFYEWQHAGRRRQPFLIRMRDGRPFGLAGLWEFWRGPDAGVLETFTILTTSANALVLPLHDRMPVIVAPEHHDLWLDPGVRDPALLMPLLRPYPAEKMIAFPVSTLVNSPRNEGAACAAPVAEATETPPQQHPRDDAPRDKGGQQLLF
ncbi:MAG: SOS response-associated peptidase, partial [Planctomycetota bacterium]|nr:SOS response-associated peptidase [Planctomycetota bacterium]